MKQIKIPEIDAAHQNAGLLILSDCSVANWIVFVASAEDYVNREEAAKFAEACGAELPTCGEMALLRAAARERFKDCFYWCKEEPDTSSAMTIYMKNGNQIAQHKSMKHRACCILRINAEIS